MNENQTTNSSDRIRGLEIALKLFEICGPATLKLDDADKATEAIVKAAGEIAQFIAMLSEATSKSPAPTP